MTVSVVGSDVTESPQQVMKDPTEEERDKEKPTLR